MGYVREQGGKPREKDVHRESESSMGNFILMEKLPSPQCKWAETMQIIAYFKLFWF